MTASGMTGPPERPTERLTGMSPGQHDPQPSEAATAAGARHLEPRSDQWPLGSAPDHRLSGPVPDHRLPEPRAGQEHDQRLPVPGVDASTPTAHTELRISDADRERVAAILRDATAEGRLTLDELDDRLRVVYATRTYGELAAATRDLPAHAFPDRQSVVDRTGARPTSTGAVAVMGGFDRRGPWLVPDRFTCFACFGGGYIDLREARFTGPEVHIRAYAVMGGVTVVVPEDAEVIVTGAGVMGGFHPGASGAGRPGSVRIVVSGVAVWGGVTVQRKPLKKKRPGD